MCATDSDFRFANLGAIIWEEKYHKKYLYLGKAYHTNIISNILRQGSKSMKHKANTLANPAVYLRCKVDLPDWGHKTKQG